MCSDERGKSMNASNEHQLLAVAVHRTSDWEARHSHAKQNTWSNIILCEIEMFAFALSFIRLFEFVWACGLWERERVWRRRRRRRRPTRVHAFMCQTFECENDWKCIFKWLSCLFCKVFILFFSFVGSSHRCCCWKFISFPVWAKWNENARREFSIVKNIGKIYCSSSRPRFIDGVEERLFSRGSPCLVNYSKREKWTCACAGDGDGVGMTRAAKSSSNRAKQSIWLAFCFFLSFCSLPLSLVIHSAPNEHIFEWTVWKINIFMGNIQVMAQMSHVSFL